MVSEGHMGHMGHRGQMGHRGHTGQMNYSLQKSRRLVTEEILSVTFCLSALVATFGLNMKVIIELNSI
jgi:hypothetical protein